MPVETEEHKTDESAAIVLKYYDRYLGEITKEKGLSSQEAKYVGSCILKALRDMHAIGYIHTGLSTRSRTYESVL